MSSKPDAAFQLRPHLNEGRKITAAVSRNMLLLTEPWNCLFWSSFIPLIPSSQATITLNLLFSAVQLPYWQFPVCIWFLLSKCSTLHLAILNLIFISDYHSRLLISSWILIQISQGFPPSQLLNIANFINVISFPFNWVITKILNAAGARADPWGISPEICSWLDSEPLMTTLWEQFFSQLFHPPYGSFI